MSNPVLVDGEAILARFLPRPLPSRFEDLAIPLSIVAADYHRLERVEFKAGKLLPAVAASMAIPGLVRPVSHEGRILVDGGVVDPLPMRAIDTPVDHILAIDVARAAPREDSETIPKPIETGFRVFDLMQAALTDAQYPQGAPMLTRIKAPVEAFAALDFFSVKKILKASAAIEDEIERALDQAGFSA
jgi:NTE family protein